MSEAVRGARQPVRGLCDGGIEERRPDGVSAGYKKARLGVEAGGVSGRDGSSGQFVEFDEDDAGGAAGDLGGVAAGLEGGDDDGVARVGGEGEGAD